MSNHKYLRKGSEVTICLDKEDITVTPGMLEYDGQTIKISKIYKPLHGRSTSGMVYMYELEDVESPLGVPYTFLREMFK